MYVAAIQTVDGIRHLTAARSHEELDTRIASYVIANTERLWPADAERVQTLLEAGHTDNAIEMYFRTIGTRWDEETLIVQEVAEPGAPWTTALVS